MNRRVASAVLVALVVSVSGLCSACCWFQYSLSKDKDWIRQALLEETPLGIDAETVRARLQQSSRWDDADVRGLWDRGAYRYGPDGRRTLVGASHLRVYLGMYCGVFLDTYVSAYYAFDAEGRLEDVWVEKSTPSL